MCLGCWLLLAYLLVVLCCAVLFGCFSSSSCARFAIWMFINVTAVHSQCTREIVMSRCARCAAYSCHWIEYHHTCWWVHQSTGADPISSSVHDLFATEDKIKPLEIILIMRKIRTIKWWAYITAKRWRWETTKKDVVFSTLFNFVTCFLSLPLQVDATPKRNEHFNASSTFITYICGDLTAHSAAHTRFSTSCRMRQKVVTT